MDNSNTTHATLAIVISAYRSAHLETVLDSVRGLDAAQVIVVDSSSHKPDLADSSVTIKWLPNRTNPALARNIGAEQARGDFILFLDSDVLLSETSRAFIRTFLKNPDSPGVCGVYKTDAALNGIYDEFQNSVLAYRILPRGENATKHGSSSHLLVRRDVFEHVGGFNPELETYEDIEFLARCFHFGHRIKATSRFEATHLKQFSFKSLVFDYALKAYNAFFVQRRYSLVFKAFGTGIGRRIAFTWLAGCVLPLAFFATLLAAAGVLPGTEWAYAAVTVALFSAPVLLWRSVLARTSGTAKILSLILWPSIGCSVATATFAAAVVRGLVETKGRVLGLSDWCRAGLRVIFRYGMPIQIVNYVTARCNLRCEHCFYKETLDARNPGELSLDLLANAMRQIGPVLWYSLAGGEPFLRRDLVDIVGLAQKHCRPKVFSFPTNGWYVERTFRTTLHILQRLDRGNLLLFFSLDGPREVHDEIRGEGSFDRVKQTMDRLRPLQSMYPKLYLNIVTTVMPKNANVMPQFMKDLIADFEPNSVSINLFRYHSLDHPPVPPAVIDAYDETVHVYERFLKEGGVKHYGFIGSRVLAIKEILQKELIYRVAKNDEFVTPCTAGTLSYVIMEDGRVSPCEILSDTIGSIATPTEGKSFSQMVRSGEARALRKWIRESKCRCTYECAMSSNTLFSWPYAARLYGRLAKSLVAGI